MEGCSYNFTKIIRTDYSPKGLSNDGFSLHHISYLYFSVLGSITTILIAFLVSLILGFANPKNVDLRLLAPCVRKYFVNEKEKNDNEINFEL